MTPPCCDTWLRQAYYNSARSSEVTRVYHPALLHVFVWYAAFLNPRSVSVNLPSPMHYRPQPPCASVGEGGGVRLPWRLGPN